MVSKTERAAGLIKSAASPHAAGQHLVQQPAVGQVIQAGVGRLDIDRAQGVVPVSPDALQRRPRVAGAAEAPDRIRKILYKMTPSLTSAHANPKIFDLGNLKKEGVLARRHELARESVSEMLSKDCRLVTLGGGHAA